MYFNTDVTHAVAGYTFYLCFGMSRVIGVDSRNESNDESNQFYKFEPTRQVSIMTKKSASRINRDRVKKMQADLASGKVEQATPRQHAPANIGAFKVADGGFKLSPADRILAECRQGLGLVPEQQKNTCWDDLTAVYRECTSLLFQHTMVSQLLGDKDLLSYLSDPITFNLNVKQFAADLGQMNVELQALYALHNTKVGGTEDRDELMHSINLYEQYRLWMERHDAVVKPVVMQILEQTNAAELARNAANAQAAQGMLDSTSEIPPEELNSGVIDVNTITDVAFRESVETAAPIEVPMSSSVNTNAKPLRGDKSPIYTIDEAGFLDPKTQRPVYVASQPRGESQAQAHHGEHHKHEHHAV